MISELSHSLISNVESVAAMIKQMDHDMLFFQPNPSVNHIAWNVGHIVYSFQAIGEEMGIPHWLPQEWVELFGQGSQLQPPHSYPEKEALLDALRKGKGILLERLEQMSTSDMAGPLPDVRFRDQFPTLGHAVINSTVFHMGLHYGYMRMLFKLAKSAHLHQGNPNEEKRASA